jgi:hypothetical protein
VLGLSVNAGPEHQAAMAQAGASALLTKEAAVDRLYSMILQTLPQKALPTKEAVVDESITRSTPLSNR